MDLRLRHAACTCQAMVVLRRIGNPHAFVLALLACFGLTGCELVKGIFKAGVWTGVLGVFAVIALVIWGVTRLLRGKS